MTGFAFLTPRLRQPMLQSKLTPFRAIKLEIINWQKLASYGNAYFVSDS